MKREYEANNNKSLNVKGEVKSQKSKRVAARETTF
jgi:hypothetical protein